MPWNRKNTTIEAQDVSKHYQQLAQDWYKKQGLSDQTQRLLVSVYPPLVQASVLKLVNKDGTVIDSGNLPKANEDMRKMLALNLPRDTKQEYYLVFANGRRIKVQPTTAPSQVLRLEREKYNNS